MADCSYIRCIQERRFVKRELQKWYKNMVYIVGEYKFFISLKSILKFIITHTKAHCVIMYTRKKEKKYHPTHHIFFILLNFSLKMLPVASETIFLCISFPFFYLSLQHPFLFLLHTEI